MENPTAVVSDDSSDTDELRRHITRTDDCKQILDDCREGKVAVEGIAMNVVKGTSSSPETEAVLNKKNVLAVLRRQNGTSSSKDVFFSSQDILGETGHPVGTPHGLSTQMKVQATKMALRCGEVSWKSETSQFSGSI